MIKYLLVVIGGGMIGRYLALASPSNRPVTLLGLDQAVMDMEGLFDSGKMAGQSENISERAADNARTAGG